MINIAVADEQVIVREGIKCVVSPHNDMTVCAEASDSVSLLNLLEKTEVDLVILEIDLPGKNGIETLKEIKLLHSKIPVLIFTSYGEEQYGLRALRAGASGYLKKKCDTVELLKAIRKTGSGGKYINPLLAEKMAELFDPNRNNLPHEALSDREYEIMLLIAGGVGHDKISWDLNISIHTYYSYRNRILDKMQMKSNVELTRYVLNNHLAK